MSTLATNTSFDQEFFTDLPKKPVEFDEMSVYAELFSDALQRLSEVYREACQYAILLKSQFDIAVKGVTSTERKQAKEQRKEIQESYGWTQSLVPSFASTGEWIDVISEENLKALDINTLKLVCRKKYEPVLEQLQAERMTAVEVRKEMKAIDDAENEKKPPKPALEWRRARNGDRSLIIRLQDAEAGTEFEAKYKESCQPLPLFLRSLLRREPVDTWQQSNNELTAYIQNQSAQVDEIAEIEKKIQNCDRLIAKFANATDPSGRTILRVSTEDREKLENRLKELKE